MSAEANASPGLLDDIASRVRAVTEEKPLKQKDRPNHASTDADDEFTDFLPDDWAETLPDEVTPGVELGAVSQLNTIGYLYDRGHIPKRDTRTLIGLTASRSLAAAKATGFIAFRNSQQGVPIWPYFQTFADAVRSGRFRRLLTRFARWAGIEGSPHGLADRPSQGNEGNQAAQAQGRAEAARMTAITSAASLEPRTAGRQAQRLRGALGA